MYEEVEEGRRGREGTNGMHARHVVLVVSSNVHEPEFTILPFESTFYRNLYVILMLPKRLKC